MKQVAYLVLENGLVFKAQTVAQQFPLPEKAGEIVFNTSHSGYEEIATDPSYYQQILVMTAPMQGNYGAHDEHWESQKFWIQGFVCLQIQNTERNSHWLKRLLSHQVPILTEIDTRLLVKTLRELGTPWGAIVTAKNESEAQVKAQVLIKKEKNKNQNWVSLVSKNENMKLKGENPQGPKVALLDFGTKQNILRETLKRSSEVYFYKWNTTAEEILKQNVEGVILSNGPGDPSAVQGVPEEIKKLIGVIPLFGICMGHQLMGLALGAKTYKLKFGHRGANHPIQDQVLNKVYMSSQNHGYAIDETTLFQNNDLVCTNQISPAHSKDFLRVSHINLNDQTTAGLFSQKLKLLSVQFHPESRPGPHESVELFDYFFNIMIESKK